MEISSLLEKIQLTDRKDVKLYFVSRTKRQNIEETFAVFNVYEMRTDDSVRSYFYTSIVCQLEDLVSPKEFLDFENSIDDFEVVSYSNKKTEQSFKAVISNLENDFPQMITSLAVIKSTEEICAQCVEFFDIHSGERIFVFSKVNVDDLIENHPGHSYGVRCDPVTMKITAAQHDIVNLDDTIDCIFYKDNFYVFNHGHFVEMTEKAIAPVFELA